MPMVGIEPRRSLEKRIRVLYLSAAGERGGAESVLLGILRHLDRSRFEPTVVSLENGAFVRELEREAKVAVRVVRAGRFRDLRAARRVILELARIMRQSGTDLVHCNGTGAFLYGGVAATMCRVPRIHHIHDVLEWSWTKQGLLHILAFLVPATARVAVSGYVARRLRGSWLPAGEPWIVPNAVEIPDAEARAEGRSVRSEFGWPGNWPLVLWCGRLQRWKGAHVFVRAAALVQKKLAEARFLVVGGSLFGLEPRYPQELRSLAKELQIDARLRFAGHREDVGRLMAASDIVVQSSIAPEPFGMVLLEAMVRGKPVIASDAGGPREIVLAGETGLLVPPNDAAALADAILKVLDDLGLGRKIGEAGRRRVEECFGIRTMIGKIEALYDALCAGGGGAKVGWSGPRWPSERPL